MTAALVPDYRSLEKCILGIFVLCLVCMTSATDEETCKGLSKCIDHKILTPGPLSTLAPHYSEDYTRREQFYSIDWCVEGYTTLTWSYSDLHYPERPRPFPSGPRGALCRQNQSLAFSSLEESDSGHYHATASNGSHSLKHVLFLFVSKDAKPVEQVVPYQTPPPSVLAGLGDNVSLKCSGHFGGGDPGLQTLDWLLWNDSRLQRIPTDSHFRVHPMPGFENTTTRGSQLDVVGVRQEDYRLIFRCSMSTAVADNNYDYNVTLGHPESKSPTLIIVATVVPCAILVMGALTYLYRKQYINYRCGLLRRRLKPRGSLEYDIFLFSHENNMEFAQGTLQPRLEALGFRVCEYHRSGPANRQEVDVQEERLRQSACTLLVYSQSDFDSHTTDTLVSMATKMAYPVVAVLLESPQVIQDQLRQLPRDQQQNMRKALELFPSLEWHEEGEEKFWDKLKRRLPRPKASTGRVQQDRPSSSQPLIGSAEEEAEHYPATSDLIMGEAEYSPTLFEPMAEEAGQFSESIGYGDEMAVRRSRALKMPPGSKRSPILKQQISKDSGFASPQSCDTAPIADHGFPRWPQPV